METVTNNGVTVGLAGKAVRLVSVPDFLDLLVRASLEGCDGIMLYKESLPEEFFDLKTGIAGEVLQKCSNYRFRLAVVGDFSVFTSKSLRDFIYESNRGRLVFFKSDVESALSALTGT